MAPKNKTAISSETSDAQQAETNFDFGISLLKAVILDQTNSASTSSIVLSPLFVLCALSQLNLGAKNKTAEEIAKIFGRGKNFIWLNSKKYFIQICNPCLAYRYVNNKGSGSLTTLLWAIGTDHTWGEVPEWPGIHNPLKLAK